MEPFLSHLDVWIGVISQAILFVIWLARLGSRVERLEERELAGIKRIDEIDTHGTRSMEAIINRTQDMLHRLERIEEILLKLDGRRQ